MHFKTCHRCCKTFKTNSKHGTICWKCKLKTAKNEWEINYIKKFMREHKDKM